MRCQEQFEVFVKMTSVQTCSKEDFQHSCLQLLTVLERDHVDGWKQFDDSVAIYLENAFLLAQTVGDESLVHFLFVSPAHRRNGLGRTLVDYLKRQAPVITTFVTANSARMFWTAMGFNPVSVLSPLWFNPVTVAQYRWCASDCP